MARVATGDVGAYHALYERHGPLVRGLARRMVGAAEADDVLQEVFSTLWLKAAQYQPARGHFVGWLLTIARNECIRVLRRRGREAQVAASEAIGAMLLGRPDTAPGPEQRAVLGEQAAALQRALATLPAEQRRVLLLAYFGGLSQTAIAEVTGWPLGTVKRRVQLGMQKLRRAYADDPDRTPIVAGERWA